MFFFFFIIIIASVRELFDPTTYVSIKPLCRHTTIEPVMSIFEYVGRQSVRCFAVPNLRVRRTGTTKTQQTLGPGQWTFIEFSRVDATGRARAR